MVGQHHRLNGHEFDQTLGDDEAQWSLACCNPWGLKEWDTTKGWDNKTKQGGGLHCTTSSRFSFALSIGFSI